MKQLLEILGNGSLIWLIVSKMKWSGFEEASFEQHQVNLEVLERLDMFLVLGVEFSVESCLSFEKKLKISLVRFWVLASLNLAAFIWTLAEQNCVVAAERGGGTYRWAFLPHRSSPGRGRSSHRRQGPERRTCRRSVRRRAKNEWSDSSCWRSAEASSCVPFLQSCAPTAEIFGIFCNRPACHGSECLCRLFPSAHGCVFHYEWFSSKSNGWRLQSHRSDLMQMQRRTFTDAALKMDARPVGSHYLHF